MGSRSVVVENCAWLVGWNYGKKALYPVRFHVHLVGCGSVAGAHHQHVSDGGIPDPLMSIFASIFRKISRDRFIKINTALVSQKRYGKGSKTLTYRKHPVKGIFCAWCIVFFKNELIISHDKKRVHRNIFFIQVLQ